MPPEERPLLLRLGIGLLAVHEVLVIGLAALVGVIAGTLVLMGAGGLEPAVLLGVGAVVACFVTLIVGVATFSLVVCFLAWRGSRVWVQVLLGVAIVNCVLVAPNPVGILAAVFCVLGGIDHLKATSADDDALVTKDTR